MKGTIQKYSKPVEKTMFNLIPGEVFLRAGYQWAFERWKQGNKSFIATKLSDGKSYSCRYYGGGNVSVSGLWEAPPKNTDIDKLKKGDLFCILHRDRDAVLYRFNGEKTRSGKLKCTNPLTKRGWTVDDSYDIKLISSLEKV